MYVCILQRGEIYTGTWMRNITFDLRIIYYSLDYITASILYEQALKIYTWDNNYLKKKLPEQF